MKTGDAGLRLIREFEGLELTAYPDPGTGGEPFTIGVGHTGGVSPGDTCTEAEAMQWLREDCETAEQCIDQHVDVDLNQHQFDATISLIFNIGCGNFRASTMLKLINAGNYSAAAHQFGRWVKAAGKTMPGLVRRRQAEMELFLS